MMVWEEYSEVVDGKRMQGRRLVECPNVMTPEEAAIFYAAEEARQAEIDRMNALREKVLEAVVMGEAVPAQDRAEFRRLMEKHGKRGRS